MVAQGILQVPPPQLLNIDFFQPQNLYYPILGFVLIAAFVARSLSSSRVGRAWNAMREDEDVAAATGINVTNYKLLAFAMGATFGCIAGTFLAVKLGSVFPPAGRAVVSITVLSVIILGGMGSIPGVIVGAFVLVGLPELLREFAEYRLLIYGAVLIGMMLWRPEGLIPSAQRRRELHDQERERRGVTRAPARAAGPGGAIVTNVTPLGDEPRNPDASGAASMPAGSPAASGAGSGSDAVLVVRKLTKRFGGLVANQGRGL